MSTTGVAAKYKVKFMKIFGIPLISQVGKLGWISGRFSFDIVRFQKFLVEKGYDDTMKSKESMKDFIIRVYSQEAADLISQLLEQEGN